MGNDSIYLVHGNKLAWYSISSIEPYGTMVQSSALPSAFQLIAIQDTFCHFRLNARIV